MMMHMHQQHELSTISPNTSAMPNTGRGELQEEDSLFKPSMILDPLTGQAAGAGSPSLFGLSLQKPSVTKNTDALQITTISAGEDPTTYRTGGASTGRQYYMPGPHQQMLPNQQFSQHLYAGGSVHQTAQHSPGMSGGATPQHNISQFVPASKGPGLVPNKMRESAESKKSSSKNINEKNIWDYDD
jgi:hypothetical protein